MGPGSLLIQVMSLYDGWRGLLCRAAKTHKKSLHFLRFGIGNEGAPKAAVYKFEHKVEDESGRGISLLE
jgi:hypothetical protein